MNNGKMGLYPALNYAKLAFLQKKHGKHNLHSSWADHIHVNLRI